MDPRLGTAALVLNTLLTSELLKLLISYINIDMSPLTLPQSIQLISQSLQDGSCMESFLSIPPQPTNPPRSTDAARYPDNFKKNRYKDILPYDETRVQLSIEADYINASQVEITIDPKGTYYIQLTPLNRVTSVRGHFSPIKRRHRN